MSWYIQALKKYAVFSGRARRREYWLFNLYAVIFLFAFLFLDSLLAVIIFGTSDRGGLFSGPYVLAMLLPSFAVTVRRLHDTGHSAWWMLIGFIPIIGNLILLFFIVQNSESGENRYGPNPKETIPEYQTYLS